MIRRKFDRLLSEGEGRQLLWLFLILLFIIFSSWGLLRILGWHFTWQEIIGLFLDGGTFSTYSGRHDGFRLLITLVGVFLFSSLVVSVFTNVFQNISTSYKKGITRYCFKNHILILGSNHMLKGMLLAIKENKDFKDKDIVVMTIKDVEKLRDNMDSFIDDEVFSKRITYYYDDRCSYKHLAKACSDKASIIYMIGEDEEPLHDSINIECLGLLNRLCQGDGAPITCYVIMENHSSQEIIQLITRDSLSRLRTEIINDKDYAVEQLLINTDFLPSFSPDSEQYLHVVIVGATSIARSFAIVTAGICHFPNYKDGNLRTVITFIDENMYNRMNDYISGRQHIFDLSHYRYISPQKFESHVPKEEYGDFLDVEWEFVDGRISSPFCRNMLLEWCDDPQQKLAIAICHDDGKINLAVSLHLPKEIFLNHIPVAVYQKYHAGLISMANSSVRFNNLICFGEAVPYNDTLFLLRSLRGKRINYLYDLQFGNHSCSSEDEAWSGITHVHQLSSIASANSIPLKMRSFDLLPTRECFDSISEEQLASLSEVEHRRWMMSVLQMGYRAATKEQRQYRENFKSLKEKELIHLDIAPYDEIPFEVDKDEFIVKNIPYIINGSDIVMNRIND